MSAVRLNISILDEQDGKMIMTQLDVGFVLLVFLSGPIREKRRV